VEGGALTSSAKVFFSVCTTRSTTDTLGVGTRSAMPFSLPFMDGSTSATALAAPVVVGTWWVQRRVSVSTLAG
jgi:hypothetical protein